MSFKIKKSYPCEFDSCEYRAASRRRLSQHLQAKHEPNRQRNFECSLCPSRFYAEDSLKTHIKRHVKEKRFSCEKCNFKAYYRCEVIQHVKNVHYKLQNINRTKAFPCPLCTKKCYNRHSMQKHVKFVHTNESLFACDSCGFTTNYKRNLQSHRAAVHQQSAKKFQCSLCPSIFYLEKSLQCHIQSHVKEKPFSCVHCEFKAQFSSALVQHVRRVHAKLKPFKCSFPACVYRSFGNKDLKSHIDARHNPNRSKDFPCPLCTKSFYNKRDVREHIRVVHTNERLHACDKCDFTTHYKRTLQQHRGKMHHKVEPGACKYEKCKFRAELKGHMDKHVRTVHRPGKKLNCKSCGCNYETKYTRELKIHTLCHEESLEKKFPFACSFPNGCDFRSRFKVGIKRHHRRHQTTKSIHRCKFCPGKPYPDRHSLQFHKWAVHNGKSYKCSMCNYSSWKSEHLANHKRLCHQPRDSTRLLTDKVSNASKRDTSSDDNKQSTGTRLAILQNEPVHKLLHLPNNFLSIPVVCLPRICVEIM